MAIRLNTTPDVIRGEYTYKLARFTYDEMVIGEFISDPNSHIRPTTIIVVKNPDDIPDPPPERVYSMDRDSEIEHILHENAIAEGLPFVRHWQKYLELADSDDIFDMSTYTLQ